MDRHSVPKERWYTEQLNDYNLIMSSKASEGYSPRNGRGSPSPVTSRSLSGSVDDPQTALEAGFPGMHLQVQENDSKELASIKLQAQQVLEEQRKEFRRIIELQTEEIQRLWACMQQPQTPLLGNTVVGHAPGVMPDVPVPATLEARLDWLQTMADNLSPSATVSMTERYNWGPTSQTGAIPKRSTVGMSVPGLCGPNAAAVPSLNWQTVVTNTVGHTPIVASRVTGVDLNFGRTTTERSPLPLQQPVGYQMASGIQTTLYSFVAAQHHPYYQTQGLSTVTYPSDQQLIGQPLNPMGARMGQDETELKTRYVPQGAFPTGQAGNAPAHNVPVPAPSSYNQRLPGGNSFHPSGASMPPLCSGENWQEGWNGPTSQNSRAEYAEELNHVSPLPRHTNGTSHVGGLHGHPPPHTFHDRGSGRRRRPAGSMTESSGSGWSITHHVAEGLEQRMAAMIEERLAGLNLGAPRINPGERIATFTDLSGYPDPDQNHPLTHRGELNNREYSLMVFRGGTEKSTGSVSAECKAFLQDAIQLGRDRRLTHKACVRLINRHCRDDAKIIVASEIRDPGSTLETVVRCLELRYMGLVEPDAAKAQLYAITRKEGENLHTLKNRLSDRAQMACRKLSPEDKLDEEQRLVKERFMTCLGMSVRNIVREREKMRIAMRQQPLTLTELVQDSVMIEMEQMLPSDKPLEQTEERVERKTTQENCGSSSSSSAFLAVAPSGRPPEEKSKQEHDQSRPFDRGREM